MSPADIDLETYEGFDEPVKVDLLEHQDVYLLQGQHGSQIRVSRSAYWLLRARRAGLNADQVAALVSRRSDARVVTPEQVERASRVLLARLAHIDGQSAAGLRLPMGFWFRWRLIPSWLVLRIATIGAQCYRPPISVFMCTLIAVAVIESLRRGLLMGGTEHAWLPAYGFFLVSVIVHEFGHASACARYAAKPGDIGFALYLIYPAFYSDVSDAWRLRRWQRVMVDLGGCYFQLALAGLFMTAFLVTGWQPWRIAVAMILYTAVFSLNPIFKFDGYWVVADALGVTNLSQQPRRIRQYVTGRLFGRADTPVLPWPAPVTWALVLYSIASVTVWFMFVAHLAPWTWSRLTNLGNLLLAISTALVAGHLPRWSDLAATLMTAFVLVISLVTIRQLATQFVIRPARRVYTTLSRPCRSE